MPLVPSIAARKTLFWPSGSDDGQKKPIFLPVKSDYALHVRSPVALDILAIVRRTDVFKPFAAKKLVDYLVVDKDLRESAQTLMASLEGNDALIEKMAMVIFRAAVARPGLHRRYAFLIDRLSTYAHRHGPHILSSLHLLSARNTEAFRLTSFMLEHSGFELVADLPECESIRLGDEIDGNEMDITARLSGQKVWLEFKAGEVSDKSQKRRQMRLAREHDAVLVYVKGMEGCPAAKNYAYCSLSELEDICSKNDPARRLEFFRDLNARLERDADRGAAGMLNTRHMRLALQLDSPVKEEEPPPPQVVALINKAKPLSNQRSIRDEYYAMRAKLNRPNRDDAAIVDWMVYSGLRSLTPVERNYVTAEVWHWIAADNSDTRFTLFKAFAVDFVVAASKAYHESKSVDVMMLLNDFAFGDHARSQTSA